jgi:hypothetical protein
MKKLLLLIVLLFVQGTSWARLSEVQVYRLLLKHEIQHPRIVMKQILLESADLTSYSTRHRNNILGLMKSTKYSMKHRRFKSVEDCIKWYKKHIQNRYHGGDYYTFLRKARYCPEKTYISRVKRRKIRTNTEILNNLEQEQLCLRLQQNSEQI